VSRPSGSAKRRRPLAGSGSAAMLAMVAARKAGIGLAIVYLFPASPAAARDCEAWKGDSEIRCLSKGKAAMAGEIVTLKNVSAARVTFSIQEWYSHCGMDADEEPSLAKTYELAPNESGRLAVMSFPRVYSDACTEFFVFRCSSSGSGVDCRTHIDAAIVPAAAVAAPPLRRACEPWKGGNEIRCVSSGSVPETLAISSRSSDGTWFSVQSWYSACQLPAEGPPSAINVQYLGSKQSVELPISFAWDSKNVPSAQSRCTEIFIFKCRDAAQFINCGDSLLATVGQ